MLIIKGVISFFLEILLPLFKRGGKLIKGIVHKATEVSYGHNNS